MNFVIGSVNLAKVTAADDVISQHFPQSTISSIEVGSGVSNQPYGDEETRLGAINRALRAVGKNGETIGIGLEGGVRRIDEQMYLCNWGALVLPSGRRFTAGGAQIPLPQEIAVMVAAGNELGQVVENYFELSGIRSKEGAIGMFTAFAVNRDDLFKHVMQLLIGQLKYYQQSQ